MDKNYEEKDIFLSREIINIEIEVQFYYFRR